MRVCFCCILLVISAVGMGFSQDTNFANGPQYLMTQGSPQFARPISTPSLSLAGEPLETGASDATADLIAGAQTQTVLPAQAITLPTVDLFPIYYGLAPAPAIEVSFSETPDGSSSSESLPASILDSGVDQMTTAQALRERGYGVTLAEAATHGKARVRHAARIYTNSDVDRLHSGS